MEEKSSTVTMCEGSVYATCKINGVSILALIDTGSAVNILKEGILANLKLGKERLHPNTKKLYGVTGKVLDTTGILKNVPICVDPNGRVKNGADLLVVTNMSEDLILGQQFLSQHKFCIDFDKNRLFNSHLSTKLVCGNNSTVIIAKVREVGENIKRNRLILRIIQLWCFQHYHIVISHNTI